MPDDVSAATRSFKLVLSYVHYYLHVSLGKKMQALLLMMLQTESERTAFIFPAQLVSIPVPEITLPN